MMRLYVNVDHVATVRQARRAAEPDPVEAAALCEAAGADGITVHLREDRRHIRDDDVHRLAAQVKTVLNLELATAPDIVALATELKPHQATFVPERRQEITTEGGLQLTGPGSPGPGLVDAIARLRDAGVRLSLFVTPDLPTLDVAARLGVDAVELHTGAYANAFPQSGRQLAQLRDAAAHARNLGLAAHAGHGLTYQNVAAVAALAEIEELNIGHSIVSRAIMVGMSVAVAEMRAIVNAARVDQAQIRP
jgi:pyridoxine 5-phosphate synthase